MTDTKQASKVRMNGSCLMGWLAYYDSLGSSELYEQFFLGNLHNICDDFHWEVRKDICHILIHISRYIGSEKSHLYVLKEINNFLDDEEGEVVTEAIVSFQKHLSQVFNQEFIKSDEAAATFEKLCSLAEGCDTNNVNLGVVLKKLGKLIIAFDKPNDRDFLSNISKLIIKARDSSFDEEIRAILPTCFEAICLSYSKNMTTLMDLYETHFQKFIETEIEAGTPKDDKVPESGKDVFNDHYLSNKEKRLLKYRQQQMCKDQNFTIKKAIAQNLHFFFGAFI